jgi:hypothetical protein
VAIGSLIALLSGWLWALPISLGIVAPLIAVGKYRTVGVFSLMTLALVTVARTASTAAIAGVVPIVVVAAAYVAWVYRSAMKAVLQASARLRFILVVTAIWCAWTVVRLCLDLPVYGALAARDALISFMFFGVILGAALSWRFEATGVSTFIRRLALVGAAYALLYPFRGILPPALREYIDFSNIGVLGVALLALALWGGGRAFQRGFFLVAAVVAIVVSQGRMIYLVAGLMIVYFVGEGIYKDLRDRKADTLSRLLLIGACGVAAVGAVSLVASLPGIEGRVGGVSIDAIFSQLATLQDSDTGSVGDRQRWWSDIWSRYTASPESVFSGLGLGPDLLNGYSGPDGSLIRKPHNDYYEALVRMGPVGGLSLTCLVLVCFPSLISFAARVPEGSALLWWGVGGAATALAQPYFAYPHGALMFALVAGAALGAEAKARSASSESA